MGIFDRFRKRKQAVALPQLCYDVAYFILPYYAFEDTAKVADLCLNSPTAAGPFFYFMATEARKLEPNIDEAKRFHWHRGSLSEGYEYFVLEYPTPPSVDMSDVNVEQLPNIVLAPYFSAIVRSTHDAKYFILGQAPMGGGTTLRRILPEGMNCNLGPGPEPRLSTFLDAVRERVQKERIE
jgi:hypothetical protein